MTHVITSLCLRDGACVDVCPVECIVPGKPEAEWPWYFIDPATCIACGACVPECPYEAIAPFGAAKYTAKGGEVIDMSEDTQHNANFYTSGPGYAAKNM